jgi:hypothetical protein
VSAAPTKLRCSSRPCIRPAARLISCRPSWKALSSRALKGSLCRSSFSSASMKRRTWSSTWAATSGFSGTASTACGGCTGEITSGAVRVKAGVGVVVMACFRTSA